MLNNSFWTYKLPYILFSFSIGYILRPLFTGKSFSLHVFVCCDLMNCVKLNDNKLSAHLTALGYFELSEDGMHQFNKDLFQCMLDNGITEADLKNTESTSCYDLPCRILTSPSAMTCEEMKFPARDCCNLDLVKHPYEKNYNEDGNKFLKYDCPLIKNRKTFRTRNGGARYATDDCYLDKPTLDNPCAELMPWREYYRYISKDRGHPDLGRLPNRCPLPDRCQSASPRIKCALDARYRNPVTPCTNLFYVGFDSMNAIRTLKHDSVTRYFQYKKLWDKQKESYEAARKRLTWEIRSKMMHIDIPKTRPSQVPLVKPIKKKKMKVFLRPNDCCMQRWKAYV